MSDADFAISAARRIHASECSTKYFYMSEKIYERGKSFLKKKDFVRAENSFVSARKYAEKAEIECILKNKRQ